MWEKKNKGITECDKNSVTCNVGSAQCEDVIIKCEKKNNETNKFDKSSVTCDVSTAQYQDDTIKCEKKIKL